MRPFQNDILLDSLAPLTHHGRVWSLENVATYKSRSRTRGGLNYVYLIIKNKNIEKSDRGGVFLEIIGLNEL